jgi:allophanate hydrolase subunit 1
MRLFDSKAAQPFRLQAGMRVRFVAIGAEQFDAWGTE